MELDELLKKYLGQFGRYQILLLLFISLEEIFTNVHTMSSVFLVGTPQHWCKTEVTQFNNCSHDAQQKFALPPEGTGGYSSCEMYVRNYSETQNTDVCPSVPISINQSVPLETAPCKSWVYDQSLYTQTMVMEWDMVCSRASLASNVAAVYMAGRILGCLVFGSVADWLGRRPVVLMTATGSMLSGVAMAFMPSYGWALVARFLLAVSTSGKATVAFIQFTEFIGPDWRVIAMVSFFMFWILGYLLLDCAAFFIRDWRMLQLVISAPEVIYIIGYFLVVPESPRWLLSKNRKPEAVVTLRKLSAWNGREYPEGLSLTVSRDKKTATFMDLFRTRGIRMVTLNLSLAWFANGFVYYGVALNTSNLGGNPFVNFLISGAIELPAFLSLMVLLTKLGRVRPYTFLMFLGGASLVAIIPVPPENIWVVITLSMVGKFCTTTCFILLWIFTTELYPTHIRGLGVNCVNMAARFSSLLAAYVGLLSNVDRSIPLVIFGVFSVTSGLFSLALPDTTDQPLTQTIDQAETFIQDNSWAVCKKNQKRPDPDTEEESLSQKLSEQPPKDAV